MKCDPLPEFKELTTEDRHEMVVGLAQVYSNIGFRKYMEYTINSQKEAVLRSENMNDVFFIKGRILTLKELYNKSKTEFEKIQSLNLKANGNKKTN